MRLSIKNHVSRFTFLFFITAFLLACNSPIAVPTSTPLSFAQVDIEKPKVDLTATPFQPSDSTNTPIPTFTVSPTITSTPTVTLTSAPSTATSANAPSTSLPSTNSSRTNYILYATLNFATKSIAVDQTIRYYNNTGVNLSELVLAIPPNLYNNVFSLNAITQDNITISSYNLSGQNLTLNLPQALPAGSATTLVMNFSLNIPQKKSDDVFGYDFNQINLVDWYPFIVPYHNGWVLHDPMPWGENLVYDSSDIELNIKTDSGVILAVGSSPEQNGEWTRYRLYGARTLALSASNEFLVHETSAGNVVIRSFYFAGGYKSGAEDIALYASQAINTFSQQFGAYPHQTLTIVQTDMDDGMEYDGLIFLASDFYSQYNGTARSNLATIGVHEVAHQWWFGLVGNDHAMEPWLDEALSTYSERIFYENNYPANISWWWQFRVNYFNPTGYVDTNIYNGQSFRLYTNAVYFQGALFLDQLRERMGHGNFTKFLQEYVKRYSYKHASSADFFAVQREIVNVNINDLLGKYFFGSY
jgi:hypothetical protein